MRLGITIGVAVGSFGMDPNLKDHSVIPLLAVLINSLTHRVSVRIQCQSSILLLFFFSNLAIFENFGKLKKVFGSPGKMWLCHRLFIPISEPDQMEITLNHPNCADKGDSYDFVREVMGNGLVTLDGRFLLLIISFPDRNSY